MEPDIKKTNKKMCTECNQILEKNPTNFFPGKSTCKACFGKKNKEKYRQKKESERHQKMLELKTSVAQEYEAFAEKEKLFVEEKKLFIEEKKHLVAELENISNVMSLTQDKLQNVLKLLEGK